MCLIVHTPRVNQNSAEIFLGWVSPILQSLDIYSRVRNGIKFRGKTVVSVYK